MSVNTALEFHDSTLAGVDQNGRDLVLRLDPAYLHRSHGQPGLDPGEGWLQPLDLIVTEAIIEALPSVLPCDLFDGSLSAGGTIWENSVALPLEVAGAVTLRLVTCNGEHLAAQGNGVMCRLHGESRYLEPFPGSR
jgi:hypothetical protein